MKPSVVIAGALVLLIALPTAAQVAPAPTAPTDTEGAADGATGSSPTTPTPAEQKENKREQYESENGHRIRWGVGLTLLRFGVQRRSDELGRERNFEPEVIPVGLDVSFVVRYEPNTIGWRTNNTTSGKSLQIVSAILALMYRHEASNLQRSRLSLGVGFAFLNGALSVLLTFDLYRGIAVADAAMTPSAATVFTGVIPRALSPRGEFTPENIGLAISFDFGSIIAPIMEAL